MERCDGVINLCNGFLPEEEQDIDGDLYVGCTIHEDGWIGDESILGGDDCNNEDALVSPVATEICDGRVNICGDTISDDELDLDGDRFVACSIDPLGWWGSPLVIGGDDCEPENDNVFHWLQKFVMDW